MSEENDIDVLSVINENVLENIISSYSEKLFKSRVEREIEIHLTKDCMIETRFDVYL